MSLNAHKLADRALQAAHAEECPDMQQHDGSPRRTERPLKGIK